MPQIKPDKRFESHAGVMVAAFVIAAFAVGAGLLTGCSHPKRIEIASSEIPYSKQLQMQKGDAYVFRLPDGKSVAVWCERPRHIMMLAEQETRSGLKTAWGERPFKRPKAVRQQVGPNSYALAGWQSYIAQGSVTT